MAGNHARQMLIGGAGIFAVLLIAGIPVGTAVTYAAVLACPLMMFAMMFMMKGGHGGHGSGHRERRPESTDETPQALDADPR